jgi:DNA-binding MarR family transcriptional regulator
MTQKTSFYDTVMIGALLTIPMQVIGRRVAAALVEHGFTDYRPTYQPVFQWCRPEGSRLTELAERVGVTKQSMGEIIDVLEQRGYVERVPDPMDGRAILIRRTQRGWEVNRIARQVVEQIQQEWVQALGQERFTSLLEALRQLAVVLDEPIAATAPPQAPTSPSKRRSRVQEKSAG